jgi:hypothetical protein
MHCSESCSLDLIEIPRSDILFQHDCAHKKMNQPVPDKPSVKPSYSRTPPNSLSRLCHTFLPVIHHHRTGAVGLHLPQNSHKRIRQDMRQHCRQYETVRRGVLNQLQPCNRKQRVLKQQQRPSCVHAFKRHFANHVNRRLVR